MSSDRRRRFPREMTDGRDASAPESSPGDGWRRAARAAAPLAVVAILAIALATLYEHLRGYHYREIIAYLRALPPPRLAAAALLTVAGYGAMTLYDTLAFRYLGRRMPYRRIALASFIGYAFNNNVGLSGLVGGSLRYRLYSAWRLSAIDVARVIAFSAATLWLGFATLGGLTFLVDPPAIPSSISLPFSSLRLLGIVFLLPLAGYAAAWGAGARRVAIRGWELALPTPPTFAAQLAVSSLDWAIAAWVLYLLMPARLESGFISFLGIFLLAQVAGLISNVPGGLGVFEMVVVVFLAPAAPASDLVGALLAFRAIYYLFPLFSAVVLLGAHEIVERREGVARAARLFGRWTPGLVPHVFAAVTFVAGAILLFSGATPAVRDRLLFLYDFVPQPLVDVAHVLGSVAGAALLVLARGLQRRLDAAWLMTVALLAAGIAASLLKGLDWEEALLLGLLLGALVPARPHFYRRASLLAERFSPSWAAAVALVLLVAAWLGLVSFKPLAASAPPPWAALPAESSRVVRAAIGALGVLMVFGIARALRPPPPERIAAGAVDPEAIRRVIASSRDTTANLALLGDKRFLVSESGASFVMYGVEGRSWVSMGDPVGRDDERGELAWRFRELSDAHNGWTVFYQVRPAALPLYLDLGLTLLKLGEEARVDLRGFTLEGRARKSLRHSVQRAEDAGCSFEIVPRDGVGSLLGELRAVSDAWLGAKRAREKGFSLGRFDPAYLENFPVAVARAGGRIVAFANLWLTGGKEELSLDLMRHTTDAPHGVIDFLFAQVMLWGRREGFVAFNLGVAPLSGLPTRSLASLWNRLGSVAFHRGETFYNFQGLRQYKEKYAPAWEPVYLACPRGLALPVVLANLASLIAGDLRGVVSR